MRKQQINEGYVKQYNQGRTFWQIAEDNNDTYKNVVEAITGHRFEARLLPNEEKDNICNLYLSGISTVKIGEKYGIWNHSVTAVLDERGVERDRRLSTRKYHLDEHYFDNLDTPNKCYIFGLLLSDGSNNPDKQTVSISLQEGDFEILEKVRLEIQSEKPLEYLDYSNKHDFGYNYQNQYRLLLFSSRICDALISHGLVKNKSLILNFPEDIPDCYISHMVRGMWDGDGTLGIYGNNIDLSLTSTEMFCTGLQKYLRDNLSIETRIYDASCHNGVTSVISITRNKDKLIFLDWMYHDANLYLERKYKKYLDIKNYLESKVA